MASVGESRDDPFVERHERLAEQHGEVGGALLTSQDGDARRLCPQITILATCAQTNGDLFAVQVRMPPGGGPPVMHRHDPSEIYYVLDGTFTFYVGRPETRTMTASAGDVVPLAGGTPHTIRNESPADAVAFVVHAPGAPMEDLTRAVAALAAGPDEPNPTMGTVLTIAAQHGIELLGPIPEPASR
jgi:mannose-6-phosphate isomerase-like protein (cupin superfamily)